MARLLTIDEAAAALGVPVASLRTAAEQHGFLIRMGRAIRIDPDTLPELCEKCRDHPRPPESIAGAIPDTGSSATKADSIQLARETSAKLKQRSKGTSPKRNGPPAQLRRIK